MTVLENFENNPVIISEKFIHDRELSLKARGIYFTLLALKESDRRLGKLVKTSVESKTAIRSGVLELESAGYISMSNGKITVLEVDGNANL